ncbi:SirB1 family protein [Thalassotalea crassostreae]|uniref:SirB1 family protein n=1 Tax=Thalassotalea crassostreae TaxID=1763536 RepID=UPI000837AEC3|nr:tetratricopeptide repeat protein [Thalassotalea crassostreae]
MKDLLLSELNSDHINLVQAVLWIEQSIFAEANSDMIQTMKDVDAFICHFQEEIDGCDDPLERAEKLLEEVFIGQVFAESYRQQWSTKSHQLSYSMAYRTIAPMLKNILMLHIFRACGFQIEAVYVPDEVMLRIICDQEYAIVFNSIDGVPINWLELDMRLSNMEQDDQHIGLEALSDKHLIKQYLVSLKTALIKEQQFDLALNCVELILALTPDDPFHRRDRGFLLQQLDCFKVAFDDYKYFIERCPENEQAKLLQIQLEMFNERVNVLH